MCILLLNEKIYLGKSNRGICFENVTQQILVTSFLP